MYRTLSAVIIFLTVACFSSLGGLSLQCLVDPLSLLFIVGIVFGGVVFSFGPTTALRVFLPFGLDRIAQNAGKRDLYLQALRRSSQLSYAAAFLGFLVGAITILSNLSDPSHIGPGFAVALICPFYSVMLSVVLFDGTRAAIENSPNVLPTGHLSA